MICATHADLKQPYNKVKPITTFLSVTHTSISIEPDTTLN